MNLTKNGEKHKEGKRVPKDRIELGHAGPGENYDKHYGEKERSKEGPLQTGERGLTPSDERANSHEEDEEEELRDVHCVVPRHARGDLFPGKPL